MDEIVARAMQKWPNVPHCFGWLALDIRGQWRMRDERTQQQGLPGDKITNPALIQFIRRNYTHDANGAWYFQNGPQRVYVDLEAAPFIARTDPVHTLVTHTNLPLSKPDAAWLTDSGRLFLRQQDIVALVDGADMATCLPYLHLNGQQAPDEAILEWIDQQGHTPLILALPGNASIPIQYLEDGHAPQVLGFVLQPRVPG